MSRWIKVDGQGRVSLSYNGKRRMLTLGTLVRKYFTVLDGEYKVIDDFEDYLIFSDGRIYSKITNKFLQLQPDKDGYFTATLYKDKHENKKRVSRLVAKAFLPNPDSLPEANHKDEVKENNNVSNLEWCTVEYNRNYGTRVYRCNCLR